MNNSANPKDFNWRKPRPRLIMTTSWDDGHPLDIRVANLLAKYGLQGTFYVPGENGHALLSDTHIRDLAQHFEVGAHTLHHADLTAVADAVAKSEIAGSRRCIEEITGKACKSFCFPRGRFGRRHVAMARDAGFTAARTVELFSLDAPCQENGLALIPTTVQAYPHTRLAYWKNCAKRFKLNNLQHAIRCGTIRDWSSVAISMLERASKLGGAFHLWGHSWEIEEAGQWQNLERVFAAMELRKRDGNCVTNFGLCQAYN
jgi:peptidoglycan/xylan/chitin deacetylase (PgdA/CDA1 family)